MSSLDTLEPEHREAGKANAAHLIAKIKPDLKIGETHPITTPGSLLAQSLNSYITDQSIGAALVHSNEKGYFAEIFLQGMPPGVPDVIGTPEADPLPTLEAAVKKLEFLMRGILLQAMENRMGCRDTRHDDLRVFELHNHSLTLSSHVVLAAKEEMETSPNRHLFSDENLIHALRVGLIEAMGSDTFDQDVWSKTKPEHQSLILQCIVRLLALGVFRYPEPLKYGAFE